MSELAVVGVGLFLAFGGIHAVSWVLAQSGLLEWLADDDVLRSDIEKWVVTTLLVGYVLLIEGRSVTSIGAVWPEPIPVAGGVDGSLSVLFWWVGGTVLTVVLTGSVLVVYRRGGLSYPDKFVEQQAERPTTRLIVTGTTAGVTESILFQAYPIERIAELSGSLLLAGIVSWMVFTAVHYTVGDTFSLEETVYIGMPALALTVVYILSGSLWVIVLVHTTVNLLSFFQS